MRKDWGVESVVQRILEEEEQTGCCVRNDGSGCVQTKQEMCSPLLSTFHKWTSEQPGPDGRTSGPVCHQDPRFCASPVSNGPHTWSDNITQWPICNVRRTDDFTVSYEESNSQFKVKNPVFFLSGCSKAYVLSGGSQALLRWDPWQMRTSLTGILRGTYNYFLL
jgi:hypothetical protein